MRKFLAAGIAAAVVAFGFATLAPRVVSAHTIFSVQGSVDCQGDYSITATGDVYAGVHLIVKLGGNVIVDVAENGTSASQTFGPFTGSSATVGESIAAYPSDTHNGATGTLTLNSDGCSTPTPSPTATPTPTPTPSASPTPCEQNADNACEQSPNLSYSTTCAVPGTAQGGSLIVEFTGDWDATSDMYPDTITVDGGTPQDVTGTSFGSGPYAVGDHVFTVQPQGIEPVNENGWPFTIAACTVPTPTPTPTATPTPRATPELTPLPVPSTGAGRG